MIKKIKGLVDDIIHDTRKTIIFGVIVLVLIGIIAYLVSSAKEQKLRQQAIEEAQQTTEATTEQAVTESNLDDAYLLQIQDSLRQSYGPLPDGYLWETDGTLLSLGDPSMSAEEVMYAYLNGLRSLDISMAQKYTRRSRVVSKYESYFDSTQVDVADYSESFYRNMYKEMLLSIQPMEIIDTSVFAENKIVYTLKINAIDLSSKDFWRPDMQQIYENLFIYSSDESDSTKSEQYLYDYILNYYRGDNAVRKDYTINLTVEKFPDLNTGWLVSMDQDVDDLCSYADGNTVLSFIRQCFQNEGRNLIMQQRSEAATSEEAKKEKKKKKKTEETTEVQENAENAEE